MDELSEVTSCKVDVLLYKERYVKTLEREKDN